MQEFYYEVIGRVLNITKEIYYGTTHVLEKHHHCMFFNMIVVLKESLYFTKIDYILPIHFLESHIFGIKPSMWI